MRNAWPLVSFGDSGSKQARFGGDTRLMDFLDESKFSSRPLFFSILELFGVLRPLAYEMTDGRVFAEKLTSLFDCDNFGFSITLFTVGEEAHRCLLGVMRLMLAGCFDGLSMVKHKLFIGFDVLLCPISFKLRRLDCACISCSWNATDCVLTVLLTEQILMSPRFSLSSSPLFAFSVSCKSFSML